MAGEGKATAAYEFWDGVAAGAGQDLLGLWTPAAEMDAAGAGVPVWRASYPADLDAAEAELKAAWHQLGRSEAALARTPARLEAFATRQVAGPQYEAYGPEAGTAEPESDLSLLLREMRAGDVAQSYDAAGGQAGRWDQAVEAFLSLIGRLERIVEDYARVETCVGGQLIAETRIGWTGDAETLTPARPDPKLMALHWQTLALALASRQALLRTLLVTLTAAAKLSALVATPGGFVLALPAVWRFINRVRIEWQQREELSHG